MKAIKIILKIPVAIIAIIALFITAIFGSVYFFSARTLHGFGKWDKKGFYHHLYKMVDTF